MVGSTALSQYKKVQFMDCTQFVSMDFVFGAEFFQQLIECYFRKQIYSMDVGHIEDVMVVCFCICAMWLQYIQAWRYQPTFYRSSNPNLNQVNFDLPNRLSI